MTSFILSANRSPNYQREVWIVRKNFLTSWRCCPSRSDLGPILSDSWWGEYSVFVLYIFQGWYCRLLPLKRGDRRCWWEGVWRQKQLGRGGRSFFWLFSSEQFLKTICWPLWRSPWCSPSVQDKQQTVVSPPSPPPPSPIHSLPFLATYATAWDHIFVFK